MTINVIGEKRNAQIPQIMGGRSNFRAIFTTQTVIAIMIINSDIESHNEIKSLWIKPSF